MSFLTKTSYDLAESGSMIGEELRVALVGCGAISELYYAPALRALAKSESLRVTALCDPNQTRLDVLANSFPEAVRLTKLSDLVSQGADIAIVASPPKFHAEQTIALLNGGVHVLCEKPMAATLTEASAMTTAARNAGRHLSVGLFRRFFPSSQFVRELQNSGALGRPQSFEWMEGGPFNWPAASPSFFQKGASPGGVMADLGVHSLDLLLWWFGEPDSFTYEDDACGGLEANCRLSLQFPGGVKGKIRLSRDTAIPNHIFVAFERGWIRMDGVHATEISIGFHGVTNVAKSQLHQLAGENPASAGFQPAATYSQAFMNQIQNVARAVRGTEKLVVPGEEGLQSLRWIETCYRERREMSQPWL
jgi:predicted dehydrogenase